LLERAFAFLVRHHDGLRLNYDQDSESLFFNESHLDTHFRIEEVNLNQGLVEKSRTFEASLNLSQDLLLKALVFTDNGKQEYLFITAHHLLTDGLSWRILLNDLLEVYQALEQGTTPVLPQKTTSLLQWQRQLKEFDLTVSTKARQYWSSTSTGFQLPLDSTPPDWSVAGVRKQELTLDEDTTRFLTKEAFKVYNTDVFTLLNVALIRSFDAWRGLEEVLVEHENHGRHLDNSDVSRTIGWFTALYPVRLRLEGKNFPEQIMSVKEQITAVPDHGLSYPLGKEEYDQNQSEVRFNYLGEFHMPENDYWAFSDVGGGLKTAPENQMTTKLELNAMVMNNRFTMEVATHRQAFTEQSINEFCDAYLFQLNQILDHLRNEQEIYFTPSDFEAELNQEELDELFN
jgi:non-ribosomal peptide synthase protein (TIGR01720 family)